MLNFPWASSPDPEILSEELEVGGVAGGGKNLLLQVFLSNTVLKRTVLANICRPNNDKPTSVGPSLQSAFYRV